MSDIKKEDFDMANRKLDEMDIKLYKQEISRLQDELARYKMENERLEDTVDHLRGCKEFESNLQNEILTVGVPLMDVPIGKTVSADQAWKAITTELSQLRAAIKSLKNQIDAMVSSEVDTSQ